MSPLEIAIQDVNNYIPRDLLEQAFLVRTRRPNNERSFQALNLLPNTINDNIKTYVVDVRVAVDLSCISLVEDIVSLQGVERQMIDSWNVLYRFTPQDLSGRQIVSVMEAVYGVVQGVNGLNYTNYMNRSSRYLQTARNILNAVGGVTPSGTAYVQRIDGHTVLVSDMSQSYALGGIKCKLSGSPDFSEIKPAYIQQFSRLIRFATQAYIYNNLIIEIDQSVIRGGSDIGRFKDIVDGYADANQMYEDQLKLWRKLAIMNDTESMRRRTKLTIGTRTRL